MLLDDFSGSVIEKQQRAAVVEHGHGVAFDQQRLAARQIRVFVCQLFRRQAREWSRSLELRELIRQPAGAEFDLLALGRIGEGHGQLRVRPFDVAAGIFLPVDAEGLFRLGHAGGVGGEHGVSRDAQRQDQRGGESKRNHAFLFQVYDPFRGAGCSLGRVAQRLGDISLVDVGERVKELFPIHTSRPSFTKVFRNFSRRRKRRTESWFSLRPIAAAICFTLSAK